jgi:CHAD domain-containing protein
VTEVIEPTATTGSGPGETGLRYRVDDRAVGERLLAAERVGPLVAAGSKARAAQHEDRYVDTADAALARAGLAVRLRAAGARTVVAVDRLGAVDAGTAGIRGDSLEGPADRVAPPADWPASDARALVLEHAGDAPLTERVTLRHHRRSRVLRRGAARVELSLDDIDVVRGDRTLGSFTELSAALRTGEESVLAELAAALDVERGLQRATGSHLAAALAMLEADTRTVPVPIVTVPATEHAAVDEPPTDAASPDAEPPRPEEDAESVAHRVARLSIGKTPGVSADDHVAEAARKVLRFHLGRMLDHEAGTRSGEDIEDLHKMRVATRRQRAAWRVFGASFRSRRTKRYRRGLREIASRLGAVRDLDVLLEGADAYRADLPTVEQRALEPLLASWRDHREVARTLLVRELDSDGYRRWLDDYIDFVRTEGAAVLPVGPVQPHRVRDTAASSIWLAYEQVRGYEPVLRWADVQTLHDLRIAGKWLRYTLEFVREALGPESAVLIARVTALQDHLGQMHDADVSASLARTFLVEHAGDLSARESAAIGRFLVDRERETARLRRTVGIPWRGVAGVSYKRALGRVVAGL